MSTHTCHALDCTVECPAILLMCWHHWSLLSDRLKQAIWEAYCPGQEIRKDPSRRYLRAAARAIVAVAEQEGRAITPQWRLLAGEEVSP